MHFAHIDRRSAKFRVIFVGRMEVEGGVDLKYSSFKWLRRKSFGHRVHAATAYTVNKIHRFQIFNVAYGFLTVGGFLTVLNIKTTVMP